MTNMKFLVFLSCYVCISNAFVNRLGCRNAFSSSLHCAKSDSADSLPEAKSLPFIPLDDNNEISPSVQSKNTVLSMPLELASPEKSPVPPGTSALIALLFVVTSLNAIDRVSMSVSIIPMASELGYSDTTKGLISSAFSLGYLVGIIPAGLSGTFMSPKRVMAGGVALWSLAQVASPTAAHFSLSLLLACRFIMGIGEAVTVPLVQTFVANWVPREMRGQLLGLILAGLAIGDVVAYALCPTVLHWGGWPGVFWLTGSLGFVWLAAWLPIARDRPVRGDECFPYECDVEDLEEQQEAEAIRFSDGREADGRTMGGGLGALRLRLDSVPWEQIRESPSVWAISVAHSAQNVGMYIILAWLPTLFNERFQYGVDDSSLSSVLPWAAAAGAGASGGLLADKLVTSGRWNKTTIRRGFQTAATFLPACVLFALAVLPDLEPTAVIGLFTLATASSALCVGGYSSSVQDICRTPRLTSLLYSLTSAPAVLAGAGGVYLTGVVLDRLHDWSLLFGATAAVYLAGGIFYSINYQSEKVFD
jgi:ACS family sodium-dependent inorganic phosphate cotransporter